MFRCLVHTSLQRACEVDAIPSSFDEESLRTSGFTRDPDSRIRLNYLTFHQTYQFRENDHLLHVHLCCWGVFSCPDYSAAFTIYALECDDFFISSLNILKIRLSTAKKSIRYPLKVESVEYM